MPTSTISLTRNECAVRMIAPTLNAFFDRRTAMRSGCRMRSSSARTSSGPMPSGGTKATKKEPSSAFVGGDASGRRVTATLTYHRLEPEERAEDEVPERRRDAVAMSGRVVVVEHVVALDPLPRA